LYRTLPPLLSGGCTHSHSYDSRHVAQARIKNDYVAIQPSPLKQCSTMCIRPSVKALQIEYKYTVCASCIAQGSRVCSYLINSSLAFLIINLYRRLHFFHEYLLIIFLHTPRTHTRHSQSSDMGTRSYTQVAPTGATMYTLATLQFGSVPSDHCLGPLMHSYSATLAIR